jgi:hypothetical protein
MVIFVIVGAAVMTVTPTGGGACQAAIGLESARNQILNTTSHRTLQRSSDSAVRCLLVLL